MNCAELASHIQHLRPEANLRDVARLCLLLGNTVADPQRLADENALCARWRELDIRMQAATDQHAAMTDELEQLACCQPEKFTPAQIWILIRAIRVQSQILQFYLGQPQTQTMEEQGRG